MSQQMNMNYSKYSVNPKEIKESKMCTKGT